MQQEKNPCLSVRQSKYGNQPLNLIFFLIAKVKIVEAPDIIRAPFGTSYELQCVATGDPPPLISWLKDGRTVI